MVITQDMVHFNILDLHETLRTLSKCHHFGHKNGTCHMQNTMGTPQTWSHFNMLDLREKLRALSQCHHLAHKNCACQMENKWAHHAKHGFTVPHVGT